MGWFFGILGGGLVFVLGVILLFLITPLRLRLSAGTNPALHYRVTAHPFSARFPALPLVDSTRPKKPKRTHPIDTRKPPRNQSVRRSGATPGALAKLPLTLRRIASAIEVEELHLDADFGLGDPAVTGQLYGRLTPFLYGARGFPATRVSLRPDFESARLSGAISTQVRLVPLAIMAPLAGFLWHMFRPFQ